MSNNDQSNSQQTNQVPSMISSFLSQLNIYPDTVFQSHITITYPSSYSQVNQIIETQQSQQNTFNEIHPIQEHLNDLLSQMNNGNYHIQHIYNGLSGSIYQDNINMGLDSILSSVEQIIQDQQSQISGGHNIQLQSQQNGSQVDLSVYMQNILNEDSDSEDDDGLSQFSDQQIEQNTIEPKLIIKDQVQECYICQVESNLFKETCGDVNHQVCQLCFDKLLKLKGCPMCRKDIIGTVSNQTMIDFLSKQQDLYGILYEIYNSIKNQHLRFIISCNFGSLDDKQQCLYQIKSKVLQLVNDICNNQESLVQNEYRCINRVIAQLKILESSDQETQSQVQQLAQFKRIIYQFSQMLIEQF